MTTEKAHTQDGNLEWPKWRLKANWLLRELARTWYGKESVFDLSKGVEEDDNDNPFWGECCYLFGEVAFSFGEKHGLTGLDILDRLWAAVDEWEACHGMRIVFSQPFYKVVWRVKHMLGDSLFRELLQDPNVCLMFDMLKAIYHKASKGEMPPYPPEAHIKPLDHYEALPVDPELERIYYG
jgi:hypothetical protein